MKKQTPDISGVNVPPIKAPLKKRIPLNDNVLDTHFCRYTDGLTGTVAIAHENPIFTL